MFSWNTADVELEEENEPKSVLDETVSFRDCEWYRRVKLFVGNETLSPTEKE